MDLQGIYTAIDRALAVIESIPEKEFDYSIIMTECGSQGCIMGHWGAANDPEAYAKFLRGGGSLSLQVNFARYLGISEKSRLFNFIVYGVSVETLAGEIENDVEYDKVDAIKALTELRNKVTKDDVIYLLSRSSIIF